MAADETRALADAVDAAVAALTAHLAGSFPDPGGESGYRMAVGSLARAAGSIEGALERMAALTGADQAAQGLVRAASADTGAARSLGQALPPLIGSAEAVAAVMADRIARDIEAAWERGAADSRRNEPIRMPVRGLGQQRDAFGDPVANAYRLGHADAAGVTADAPGTGRRYLPGQRVTTVLGKSGFLTGAAGPGGNPRVQFDGGGVATVPRGAIAGPVVHVFDDPREAMFHGENHPAVAYGDVLHAPVPADPGGIRSYTSLVTDRDKPMPAGGQSVYAEGRRLYEQLIQSVSPEGTRGRAAPDPVRAAFPVGRPSAQPSPAQRGAAARKRASGRGKRSGFRPGVAMTSKF